jgi:hypothetical protein
MPSPFDALDATLQANVAAAYSEVIRILPRVASQYGGPQPDPARPAMDVRGIFSLVPETETIGGQNKGGEYSGTTMFNHGRAEVWLEASEFASLGYQPRKLDLVILTDRVNAPQYAVTRLAKTGQGDVALILAAEGSTPV